jgi:hypothetical protein
LNEVAQCQSGLPDATNHYRRGMIRARCARLRYLYKVQVGFRGCLSVAIDGGGVAGLAVVYFSGLAESWLVFQKYGYLLVMCSSLNATVFSCA